MDPLEQAQAILGSIGDPNEDYTDNGYGEPVIERAPEEDPRVEAEMAQVGAAMGFQAIVSPEDYLRPGALTQCTTIPQRVRVQLTVDPPEPEVDDGRALRIYEQQTNAARTQLAAHILATQPDNRTLVRSPQEAQRHANMAYRLRLAGVGENWIAARWD